MPNHDPAHQREFAVDVVRKLRDAGFQALWAGGCVRDQLLGLLPKDYDVATDARPEQVRQVFGAKRTIPVGAAFGVITVVGPKTAGHIEVATFRTDGGYSDGRHPDSVTFSTPEHDAQRRDFTINGLFFDPLREEVVDYVGGQADLGKRILRAIRNPEERFAEDKLRMLRAVRFAATYDFQLEPATLAAIQHHAVELASVSAERIAAEMRRIMVIPRRAEGLRLLATTNLRAVVFPMRQLLETPLDPAFIKFPVTELWDRSIAMVDAISPSTGTASFPAGLAAFFQPWNEIDDQRRGLFALRMIAELWKLANDEVGEAAFALEHEAELRAAHALPWPRIQRILIRPAAYTAQRVAEAAVQMGGLSAEGVRFSLERLLWPDDQLNPPLLLTGNDLIREGYPPGPKFREVLDAVRDEQLLGNIKNRSAALAFAKKRFDATDAT